MASPSSRSSSSRPRVVRKLAGPSVDGVTAALGKALSLEVIDQGYDSAPMHQERITQRLLGPTLSCSEMAEHAVVPRVQTQRGKALGETSMSQGAQLRQQKPSALAGGSGADRRIVAGATVTCHRSPLGDNVYLLNCSK